MSDTDLNNSPGREPLRFLVFSASLRKNSLNTRLIKLAAEVIEKNGSRVDFADMKEFDCPSYNQDVETEGTFPDGTTEFRNRILANDAIIISSPEFNSSVPGFLKNAIDWVSRFRPQPFNERHVLLMSVAVNGRWQPRTLVFKNSAGASWGKSLS